MYVLRSWLPSESPRLSMEVQMVEEEDAVMESIEEVILSEVRDHYPFLYNVRDRKYRIKEERDKAWEEIASIVDLDVKSCKTRWRSVRDRYLKERRRGPKDPDKRGWRLMPKLAFLDDMLEAKAPRTPTFVRRKLVAPHSAAASSSESSVTPSGATTTSPSTSTTSSTTSTTARRLLLPAVALSSPRHPPPTTPGGATGTGGVVPVSILKASSLSEHHALGTSSTSITSTILRPAAPCFTTASPTTSLFLLPATTGAAVASAPPNTITTTSVAATDGATCLSPLATNDPLRKDGEQKTPLPQNLDEEDYYGLSVAGRLKKLSQRDRALVRIEIEKLFLKHDPL